MEIFKLHNDSRKHQKSPHFFPTGKHSNQSAEESEGNPKLITAYYLKIIFLFGILYMLTFDFFFKCLLVQNNAQAKIQKRNAALLW